MLENVAPCVILLIYSSVSCLEIKMREGIIVAIKGSAAYAAIQNKENQIAFSEADPALWLARANPTIRLYECTRGSWGNSVATTILKW